jgi:N-acetylglucosamine-6-phosphate deacetylase
MHTAYKNALIFNSDTRRFEEGTLILKDGIIEKITDLADDCANIDDTVDVGGARIIPGLVDIHTHGRAGFDFTYADGDSLSVMLKSYAAAGTTSLMATFASAPISDYETAIDAVNIKRRNRSEGEAQIMGMHLEGRYINPLRRGAHATELLAPPNNDELSGLTMRMLPLPIHVSCAPELENGESFIRHAVSLGATVSLAHSDASYEQSLEAVSWGAVSFTHLYNAMRPILHRNPGNAVAALMCDTACAELICDGLHIAPPMIALASRAKPRDKVILITDSMEAAGCDDGQYSLAGTKVTVKDGLAINNEGNIAGSTLNLFTGMCNYAKFCSVPIEEAICAATINPAKLVLGGNPDIGKLEKGKKADFIVLKNDTDCPQIKDVYIGGVKI